MKRIILLFVLGIFLISACAQQKPEELIGEGSSIETSGGDTQVKEFEITAKQFSFEPSTIEVNRGDKVKLIVTSVDVPHGFAIPEYDINERLDPGKEVVIEFTANKQGTFTVFCSVFCGSGHSGMKGKIIVK